MTNKFRAILAMLNCVHFVLALEAQQVSGTLTGSVTDTSGNPVAGATIRLRRVPTTRLEFADRNIMRVVRAPGDVDFDTAASAGSAGAFSFSNLPPGGYVACAEFQSGYVNNCEWTGGTVLTVPASGSLLITATPSAVVSVQVSDSKGFLLTAVERPEAPLLNIGVLTADGAFHRAAVSASSSISRTYTVQVLPGQRLTVRASSAQFLLGGPDGEPLSGGFVGTGASATAGQSSSFPMTVIGVK